MKSCTFFGHRDTEKEIEPIIKSTLIELIEKNGVDTFYVGNNGNFDIMVKSLLGELKSIYPQINYFIVYAYAKSYKQEDLSNAIYPVFLKKTLSQIPKRNEWMIERNDYVITYVSKAFGGAARFKRLSERKGKRVIELSYKLRSWTPLCPLHKP